MSDEYTQLKDRKLWFDGESTVEPEFLVDLILRGVKLKGLYVSEITDEVKQFNRISEHKLSVKQELKPFSFEWNIPEKYKEMNLRKYVMSALVREVSENPSLSSSDIEIRKDRVEVELELYYQHNLHMLLRTVIYIIETFEEQGIVWGVGRGSSCSSYILYLIGVHDIDSVFYDLDISDFLR